MSAGKNVISEKPVARSADELAKMIEASRRTGRLFSVHQNRRWDKDFLIVKKAIADGSIGTPFYIESRVQGLQGRAGRLAVRERGGAAACCSIGAFTSSTR
jgi:scyllo-inositol 2-dehydrogenase (NADP+)